MEWCAKVHDPGDSGGDGDRGGRDHIPTKFQFQFEAIVSFLVNISESARLTLGDIFSLTLRRTEAVANCWKECQEAKDAAPEGFLLAEQKIDELTQSVSFFKDRVERLLVDKGLSRADSIALIVEHDSLRKLMAAKDPILKGIPLTESRKADYVELFNGLTVQQ